MTVSAAVCTTKELIRRIAAEKRESGWTMTLNDFLHRLNGVTGHDGQYKAKCPAHADKKPSLSVGLGDDNRILIHCQAGCSVDAVLDAMGLSRKDLFVESANPGDTQYTRKPQVVATYDIKDDAGNVIAQKLRREDKSFIWRRPDGKGGWIYNRKGVPHRLYLAGELTGVVYVVEGEKDANNLHRLGCNVVSGMDGAGPGKWRKEYTEQLRGLSVVILPDNDTVGLAFAKETANTLSGAAKSVRLLDLSTIWSAIPEHGDISDMIQALGEQETARLLSDAVRKVPEWKPEQKPPSILSLFRTLEDFPEEEADWLVPGWIPAGQISLIAADGGVGKTTLWCHIIAALSNGTRCILDPEDHTREPMKITFMTTEDSVRKKLRRKLRLAGANMKNIITPDFVADTEGLLRKVKFGSPEMELVLWGLCPSLCIFDPVQGFVPPKVNMGSRNEMRDSMAPLISLGEELKMTSLVICHTNKRKGASGRDRIADSAIARSVMMSGFTEEHGVRYLSNEKNNYAPLQETTLFIIDENEQICKTGTSWKRDRDYIGAVELSRTAPRREDCKAFLLQTLADAGGSMPTAELEDKAAQAGYSYSSVKRAKRDLKKENVVGSMQTGGTQGKVWHTYLTDTAQNVNQFVDVPEDEPLPF